MHDWVIMEHGDAWPHQCAACKDQGSLKNPLTDTHVDLFGAFTPDPHNPITAGGHGRLYICKRCCRLGARIHGFSAGKKLDELQNASEALAAKDKDITTLQQQIEGLTNSVADRDRRLKQQQIVIDNFEKRAETYDHLAGILTTNAEALKAVS